MKHGESGGPEPLTFTHNGEPATINLERFQQQPQGSATKCLMRAVLAR
ncbi:hypothetical protein GYM96_21430 [Pseudomonas fragi]|nr:MULTISPECIES: hypothetical protein [Pseudomonas]MBM1202343.1 hypothetical protein [Pseudomonas fragi]MDY7572683.1 hypothetical protein [Pseudomonas sp. CCC4.1]MEB0143183.1 hypothetical protein [Pseudomonas sp. CCC4.1]